MSVSDSEYMTAREVADVFGVNPKTVSRWGKTGKLSYIKNPGSEWKRYLRTEVESFLVPTERTKK